MSRVSQTLNLYRPSLGETPEDWSNSMAQHERRALIGAFALMMLQTFLTVSLPFVLGDVMALS